ncbi:hypothetical protein [Protofrankia coriariae]|uniref:SnoaL-like domain-containing protein n=1 Tax=Protofrankia coriariae TaxID=1562887 RepID=A0ABR5EZQ8_9ACTN|nr:hypothetical protein [Protofrankia coriariae]KLL09929.1 hypothetical protein FrCorBMG51_21375 [Protofrankia coriariae]
MAHYNFGIKWLKAFRESAEAVSKLYADDGFIFEDVMLDQYNINNKPDLHRVFGPYANKDPENGIGIHNFRIRSYIGDERVGLLRWEWSPEHAAVFLGLDVAGKPFGTQGHTFHIYNEQGLITRESSWWDASAVLRAVGPVSPTKSLTGTKPAVVKTSGGAPFTRAASGLEHAQRWAAALGSDTAALADLYADYFTVEWTKVDDHLDDTVTDRETLVERLGGIASGENGTYTFTPTAWFGGANDSYGLIHWNVRIEGATTYRGLPTSGKTLETVGSTFHQFDSEGKIILESTYWEDNTVFEALGVPVVRPHYWDENFDPASLLPG